MQYREFPILEFDESKDAFIRPGDMIAPADVPERCVLCFFDKAIEKILSQYEHRVAAYFQAETIKFPIYELIYNGQKVALVQAAVGAPLAAAQIEELTAMGCGKYIACGSCGVLQQDLAAGHLIIPVSAVRDEGTSYHYAAPTREIHADLNAVERIETTIENYKVPYIKAKTWTTDAIYRETPEKIKLRKQEDCVTVEMEASAYMAAAQYNGVIFGQILYAGDNLGGDKWDSRDYDKLADVRELVLRIAMDACMDL